MGYNDVIQIETMEKESGALTSTISAGKLQFRPIQRFDNDVDELWDKEKDAFEVSVIRDAAFLNWRYLQRPDQKYSAFGAYEHNVLVGYVILKLYRDDKILKGHIIDIFSLSDREDAAEFLVHESENYFNVHKTNIESSWVSGSALYHDILRSRGFKPVRPRPLICRINLNKDKYARLLDGRNWYFAMGDTTEIY
jgi:hypothetical protein